MLKLLNKNLRLLWHRFRWKSRRHSNPVIIVRKSHNHNHNQNHNHNHNHNHNDDSQHQQKAQNPKNSAVYPNTQMGNKTPQIPIKIATFNAALFSMAPAVVPNHLNDDSKQFSTKSLNDRPKSILKPSPLHPNSLDSNYTNNNNTESLTMQQQQQQQQQKFSKSKLRVSINLPDNEISLGRSRRIGVLERRSGCDWGDEGSNSNRAVVDVLRELDADILALQDVKAEEGNEMKPLSDLAAALGMNYVFAESWAPEFGNAVLSKWPINYWNVQKIFDDSDFRNVLKAKIEVPQVGEVNFYCTHLDHLDENWRMKQINYIIESNNNEPHILAGGLNSLDEGDYSHDRWTDIIKYYEDIGKPTPKAEVMRYLKNKQYTDAKDFAGECESVVMIAKGQSVQGTCKYGTRVDYILGSPGLDYKFAPGSYGVLSSKGTSDHHIVKVDIFKTKKTTIQQINTTSKKQLHNKKRVIRITTNSSSRGLWSTDMR